MVTDRNKIVMLPSNCYCPCSCPSSEVYHQGIGSGKERLAREATSFLALINRNGKRKRNRSALVM